MFYFHDDFFVYLQIENTERQGDEQEEAEIEINPQFIKKKKKKGMPLVWGFKIKVSLSFCLGLMDPVGSVACQPVQLH